MANRLELQMRFIIEMDKLKSVFRQTRIFDNSRQENDAEHAWHLALMALTLAEYANDEINVNRVIRMVLVHDIVEADAGDTFLYDDAANEGKAETEKLAAERIFGLLPLDQKVEFISLWEEFEARQTADARFAAALDRIEPIMQNALTSGHAWRKHNVRKSQVVEKTRPIIEAGSRALWKFADDLIGQAVKAGFLAE
jgi:putative hydrolases of HD superfamily